MRQKLNIALLIGYIAFLVGMCVSMVGQPPKITPEPIGWATPFVLFLVMATPAFLGYMIGRDAE